MAIKSFPIMRPTKILLVDDEKFLLDMYRIKFEHEGFTFVGLESADGDLVAKVLAEKPDVVTLDFLLRSGERDGLEALRILKSDPRTAGIPVFMLSNQLQKKEIERAAELGPVDWLIASMETPSAVIAAHKTYLRDPAHYKPLYREYVIR